MNNNSMDINKLLSMLSNMDKNQLESGLAQIQRIIDSKNTDNNNK